MHMLAICSENVVEILCMHCLTLQHVHLGSTDVRKLEFVLTLSCSVTALMTVHKERMSFQTVQQVRVVNTKLL